MSSKNDPQKEVEPAANSGGALYGFLATAGLLAGSIIVAVIAVQLLGKIFGF